MGVWWSQEQVDEHKDLYSNKTPDSEPIMLADQMIQELTEENFRLKQQLERYEKLVALED
jgi:dynactin complex subunit